MPMVGGRGGCGYIGGTWGYMAMGVCGGRRGNIYFVRSCRKCFLPLFHHVF